MARSQPVSNLGLVHEPFRDFTRADIPLVASADEIRDDKLDGAEACLSQDRGGVLQHIGEPVIEGDDEGIQRTICVEEAAQRNRLESSRLQFAHLDGKQSGADVEGAKACARRAFSHLVVHENGAVSFEVVSEGSKRGVEFGQRIGQWDIYSKKSPGNETLSGGCILSGNRPALGQQNRL